MANVQRLMMRAASGLNIRLYRASGGRLMGKIRGVPVLLLTVAGRKSGVEHTTPVSYLAEDGRYIVTGSAGGAAAEPQWFRNLRQAGHAVIEASRWDRSGWRSPSPSLQMRNGKSFGSG
ncbi:MAG: nitroreductase/quinone reductase family protein [Geodermatophilaceae bacterium]